MITQVHKAADELREAFRTLIRLHAKHGTIKVTHLAGIMGVVVVQASRREGLSFWCNVCSCRRTRTLSRRSCGSWARATCPSGSPATSGRTRSTSKCSCRRGQSALSAEAS